MNDNKVDNENAQELAKKVEATLFLAGRWLKLDEIVSLTGINPIMARELLQQLEQKYNQSNSGLIMLKRADQEMWKMDVKPQYSALTAQLATGKAEFTKAEQATLALIAYKQPIKQSVVVRIRGNKAYEHIKALLSARLIQAKKAGRTLVLSLAEGFYDYFNLKKATEEQC